jgi:hypothetical protein
MGNRPSANGWLLAGAVALVGCGAHPPSRQPAPPAPTAVPNEKQQKRLELVDYIENIFEQRYAPAQFKEQRFGWQLEAEIAKLRARVQAEPDLGIHDMQRALFAFFRSPRDIHTDIVFSGDRGVWLGVRIARVKDRYYLSCVDRSVLPHERFAFEPGDEVTAFGGKPPRHAIRQAKAQAQYRSTEAFEQALAELVLTYRTSREWDEQPRAGHQVALDIRRGSAAPTTVQLTWVDDAEAAPRTHCPFAKTKRSRIPPLGEVRWHAEESLPFVMQVFEHQGVAYGYLRFHSYDLDAEARLSALSSLERALRELDRAGVKKVVLDQTGNGGGNYLFAYALLSRLTGKRLSVPLQHYRVGGGRIIGLGTFGAVRGVSQQLAAIQSEEAAAQALAGHPIFSGALNFAPKTLSTVEHFRGYLDFFERYSAQGDELRLTEPHYQVEPWIDPWDGGKPFGGKILLLIDELNISAAEYAAATLKDSGRARVLGATTSGAGGDQRVLTPERVCGGSVPPLDGFTPCVPAHIAATMRELGIAQMSYTVTLGVRFDDGGANLGFIENRGVEPHETYSRTVDDLRHANQPYRDHILKTLVAL